MIANPIKNEEHIFWMGIKESEIHACDGFFEGAVTFFGGNSTNRSFSNIHNKILNTSIPTKEQTDFFIGQAKQIIKENEKNSLMFYSPGKWVFALDDTTMARCLCMNDKTVLDNTSNKFYMFELLQGKVPCLERVYLEKEDCSFSTVSESFFSDSFVIQEQTGAGGSGTMLYNRENCEELYCCLDDGKIYTISKYCDNCIPINTHCIIGDQEALLFPPSIQIIVIEDNHFNYKGADFIGYRGISKNLQEKTEAYSIQVCDALREVGYRGIVGIDYIVYQNEVFFIEVNNRFQASSSLLNKALKEHGLPTLQEMNLHCFRGTLGGLQVSKKDLSFDVPYSCFIFKHSESDLANIGIEPVLVFFDGYDSNKEIEDNAYMYTHIFNQSIYEAFRAIA